MRNRRLCFLLLATVALTLPACTGDGNFTILGYTTRPNYDETIRTVYVPIFENRTVYRGLEFYLTRAVIREVEAKTPFKVVASEAEADTQLKGTIVNFRKLVVNANQQNEIREAEGTISVELVWRDLRAGNRGQVLSQPAPPPPVLGLPPGAAPPPPPEVPVQPVLVQGNANFIPEVGGSLTSAQIQAMDQLAIRIVSMMEKPW